MSPYLNAVKSQALALLNAAFNGGNTDAHISLVEFRDPAAGYPDAVDLPFTTQTQFADRISAAQAAINNLYAYGGGDVPEGDNSGLLLALNGSAGRWRDSALTRRIALFTDAPVKDTDLAATVRQYAHNLGLVISSMPVARTLARSVNTLVTESSFMLAATAAAPLAATTAPFAVQIYTIQVGNDATATGSIRQIATDNGGTFFNAPTPAELTAALTSIITAPPLPTYTITATDALKPEGNAGTTPFTFTVSRAGDASGAATLGYTVVGTGAQPATADDFTGGVLPSGQVAFAAGETSKVLSIGIAGDTLIKPDKAFSVTLNSPDALIAISTATGTIQNDDATPATPMLGYVNATNGTAGMLPFTVADAGGPSYLQNQYIYAGSDSIAFSTMAPNVFIHAGTGNDAIQVATGQNVLDGGLGSNFLVSGTGIDTFFTDARDLVAPSWNTIANFHAGDAATLWGFADGVSSYAWDPNLSGAPGSMGATLRATIAGGLGTTGTGVDVSITFAGLSIDQAKGLQVATGTQPAGSYLYVYNPGV